MGIRRAEAPAPAWRGSRAGALPQQHPGLAAGSGPRLCAAPAPACPAQRLAQQLLQVMLRLTVPQASLWERFCFSVVKHQELFYWISVSLSASAERRHVGLEEKEAAKPRSRLQARCVLLPHKTEQHLKTHRSHPGRHSPGAADREAARGISCGHWRVKPVPSRYNFLWV